MRDILAALLRDRGYTHDEDSTDDYWYHPSLGVRPLMVCVQWEIDRDYSRAMTAPDRVEFTEAFRAAVSGLDEQQVALALKVSRPTIERWTTGRAAPHRLARAGLLAQVVSLTGGSRSEPDSATTHSDQTGPS